MQETHEVKTQPFLVVEKINATVESRSMVPLKPDTENWTTLKIREISPEGTKVANGDVIVAFETEDLEQKMREAEQAVELGRLDLQASELDLEQLQRTLSLDQALAEREIRNAQQDFKYFTEVARPNQERTVRRSVENSQHSLEYAQEEYNQLKRMYDEDELTEESEEIVLKRTQRDVESRQFYLEQAQLGAARTLDYDLPREMEQKSEELERARLEHERVQVTLPLEREKKKVAVDKSRIDVEKQQRELAELADDLTRMTMTAPSAGVLYYGQCVRGAWTGVAGAQRDLQSGQAVPHDKTLVTLVDPDDLFLRADLTEKQLASIRRGAEGLAHPTAMRDVATDVTVSLVNYVPVATDKFDCQLVLADPIEGLMPGMTCEVRFIVHQNEAATAVPVASVFTDDGVTHFVFVAGEGEDAEPERREVETGLSSETMTEVTSGLKEGEKILLKRPE